MNQPNLREKCKTSWAISTLILFTTVN